MGSGYAKFFLLLALLSALTVDFSSTAQIFTCSSSPSSCTALVGYVPVNDTDFNAVRSLFNVTLRSLNRANRNFSRYYGGYYDESDYNADVDSREVINVPINCVCFNNTGTSWGGPIYKVQRGDSLSYIANKVFSRLVEYPQIMEANGITDSSNVIEIGQELKIPLPCSCDSVNGERVVHYAHMAEQGTSLAEIALQFGTDEGTLARINRMTAENPLNVGQPIDVPFRLEVLCLSSIEVSGMTCENFSAPNRSFNAPGPGSAITDGPSDSNNLGKKLGIGLGSAGIFLLIICILTTYFRRKTLYLGEMGFLRKFPKIDLDLEAFLKINGSLAPKRYSYSDIRKMTNSFKEKLGKGGYGTVYKGKLLDGRVVAVKMLDTSKGNGQEFANEVASISRTSHVNVVTLLGFCLEGQKRALIYEFLPNGSLERFIYKENTNLNERQQLAFEEFYRIAIGIAQGLEYLHRGCNTRIVHFDIKPHNILLDENFCPKISDFGLAKLCIRNESFVSMIEARGTIGYIAPEVFCRSVGGVSHKSDVYSYGMMILEMVGGRRNIDVRVSQTSKIYFPDWIYRQLEEGNFEPRLLGIMNIEETEIARKMILVGLWCIQTNPPDRPRMSKVIEMLEGSIEALQIPPRPYLFSPPRSPVDSTS